MSRLGRVPPSAGRDVVDRKACFLSLLAQAAVWLLELRVSRTFLDNLRPQLLRPWIRNSMCCHHFLSSLGACRVFELRVSRTFLDNLWLICSVHGYPARRAARAADPDDSPRSCSTIREGVLEGLREWNPNRPVSEMAADPQVQLRIRRLPLVRSPQNCTEPRRRSASHLPMQKRWKMRSRMSSVTTAPTTLPSSSRASLRSSATSSSPPPSRRV